MEVGMIVRRVLPLCLAVAVAVPCAAQGTKSKSKQSKTTKQAAMAASPAEPPIRGNNTKEGASQANKAAKVFREIMAVPDKGIPRDLLAKAECIAVYPAVIKAGFIIGGKAGRGVATCRTPQGWSAPAYLELKGGSVGFQIGADATDLVLLFMNTGGLKSQLNSKVELGADASVAAGPVGREASAATDAAMNAQILSYSRTKGLFAGLSLKGTVISPDKSDMEGTYGKGVTAQQILEASKTRAPSEVQVFPDTVAEYSARTATNASK